MKRRRRAIVVLVIFTFVCLALATALESRKYVAYNTGRAVSQSKQLAWMCAAYCDHKANPERGKYPATLALLADPPFTDKKNFLVGGEQDLIDPWGNPYRYAIVKNPNGEEEVYVWSERVVDGKLKLLGAKRKADGVVEVFGLEK